MLLQPLKSPGIDLTIQRCIFPAFDPPHDIFIIGQLVTIQQAMPSEPAQAAKPANLMP